MKFQMLIDFEAEIVESIDEMDNVLTKIELFRKDETFEADIFDENDKCYAIQFGDGSCLFGLPKEIVKIVDEK